MDNDGYEEYKVDDRTVEKYLQREKFITITVNRIHGFLKYYYESKYEVYYKVGEQLYELWNIVEWRGVMEMCNQVYVHLAEEYRDEFTPKILWHCLRFFEFVRDKEEIWIKLRKLYSLYKAKEEGKMSQIGTLTITGYLEGEVKNIEEEIKEIFDAIRKVYPDWMVIDAEDIVRGLEPVEKLVGKSLKNILGYRILWEMYHENVPSYRLIEAVKIGSAYRDKKTLETLRREYSRLGGRKPKRLPPLFCHLCGAQLDWDDKNIVWIHVPVELRCLKEYLIKASTGDINMTIEDEGILEELCMELIRKYNIEEIGEGEEK